jgi:hypothetical protein
MIVRRVLSQQNRAIAKGLGGLLNSSHKRTFVSGWVNKVLLRRIARLLRLHPGLLQRLCLLFGRSRAVYDLPKTGVHHLVEVLRSQYVDVVRACLVKSRVRRVSYPSRYESVFGKSVFGKVQTSLASLL